jgi:hypothetical protein
MIDVGKKTKKQVRGIRGQNFRIRRSRYDYTGLNKATISKACNDQEYKPTKSTMKLLIDAARFLTKQNIKKDDFWM